jgi:hypothetical protein
MLAWLVLSALYHLYFSVVRAYALTIVVWAIPAAVNVVFALLALVFVWPYLLPIIFAPFGAASLQLPLIPSIWGDGGNRRTKILLTLAVLVGGYLLASVGAWIATTLVGWIADLNPCVSWKAGVTGKLPPSPDCR